MYLIVIAWMYVVIMMSVAEATSSNGSLLGALITLVLYGFVPVALVVYLMGAPARNKAVKQREAQARAQHLASASQPASTEAASDSPDAGGHAAGGAKTVAENARVAPVGKEP
ncbi:MAG: hypothetical protein ACWA6Y_06105 [Polaromonas sp.]